MSIDSEVAPFVVRHDEDRFLAPVSFLNGRFDCKVSARDTDGDLCIYDTIRSKPGGPPLHYHESQDEWFFVREGEFLFRVGEATFRLKAGDSIFAPRKVAMPKLWSRLGIWSKKARKSLSSSIDSVT